MQQAGELLEKTLQTDSSAKNASKAVAKAVVQKAILDHKDKANPTFLSTLHLLCKHIGGQAILCHGDSVAGRQGLCSTLLKPHFEASCARMPIYDVAVTG